MFSATTIQYCFTKTFVSSHLQHHFACSVFNVTSDEQVKQRTCGCEGETPVDCNWGTLDVTGKFGEYLEVTFCNMGESDDDFPGVVSMIIIISWLIKYE